MKKDEFNKINVNNSDGRYNVDEDSLKHIKEIENVSEIEKEEKEVFQSSEDNKIQDETGRNSFDDASNSGSGGESGASSAGASAGAAAGVASAVGIVAVVAVSAVFVLGVVKLPTIPAVDVHLIAASSSSLAFSLNTNIENHEDLTITLRGAGYELSTSFQEYVKFTDLKQNEVYKLSVFEKETSRYSSNFYTNDREDVNNISIVVTSYIDDKLYFYFEDSVPGDKLYTVTVKNKKGTVIFNQDTTAPQEYEIDDFKEDVAIFVSVNGTITAGIQVFKPIYDYENINWVWGDYGETVTAIIPSLNETDDYYVRDIRNFEIDRVDPTCTEDGYVVRQAAFIGPDKNRYEDQKEFILPASGHDFSDVTYIWSNHYLTCEAESICPVCGAKIEESVEAIKEEIVTDSGISYTKYTASFENENFEERKHYENLTYGKYPQSKETDADILSNLNQTYGDPNTQSGSWLSYQYYAESSISSYMYYVDVDIDNDNELDYRGIYFTSYRPIDTTDALGNSSYQYDNGYLTNTAYWFKYEPIKWHVLEHDEDNLFITSEIVLDSQSFYHEVNTQEFEHNSGTGYANNYKLSDIRTWLNNEFYNSAFMDNRDSVINTTSVDNSIDSTLDSANPYTCEETEDKLFLLSRYEVSEYLAAKGQTTGSDYAKAQGLYVALENDNAFWGLRTPYVEEPYQVRYVTNNGNVSYDSNSKTSLGVRPACWINIG